jgi:hypothetical protein
MNSISPKASSVVVSRGIPVDLTLHDFLSKRFRHIGRQTWKSRSPADIGNQAFIYETTVRKE